MKVEIKLDKACFQHDMAYEDFKDLARRTACDKVLSDEIFNIAKNPKYDEYQRGLASMVYNLFHNKSSDIVLNLLLNKMNTNEPEEVHKPVIRKF